jgi:tRNA-2-methylthio-N6-dimethylallyladenosine synthase
VETRNERPRTGEMQWRGRDGGNRVVNIAVESAQDLTGKEVEVKIIQAKKHSLIGEVLP